MKVIALVEPQPVGQIHYMLGGESWLDAADQTPIRLHCEEWGNLGPMELNAAIPPNAAGFRVRSSDSIAPPGAIGVKEIDGKYFWTDTDCYGRVAPTPSTGVEGGDL